ncbi:hypothetical protein [uncultured Sphingomonas sp.]|uniref:LexA family protein n=1 Tax=uncultured Sphingomonas sp. TaxID=158754 RepID=UPI002588A125|nr:hypothetical protein [uncultured Sphingomonas sp.]
MASRELQALAFIRSYIGEWGHSPSFGEIARAIGCPDTKTVARIVKRLVRKGRVLRQPGAHRGLMLPDDHSAALARLVASGWKVNGALREISAPSVTNTGLMLVAVLDHDPDSTGDFQHDDNAGADRAM